MIVLLIQRLDLCCSPLVTHVRFYIKETKNVEGRFINDDSDNNKDKNR